MPVFLTAATAAALAVTLVAFMAVVTYNAVVALGRRCDRARANVDACLRQRWDELPNLVSAVRGAMELERGILDEVAHLRAAYQPDAGIRQQAVVSARTSRAVAALLAVVEAWPELRSHEKVLAPQREIARLETVIAQRRELYNDQVFRYNATIAQVPAALLRPFFGWQPRESFDAGEAEQASQTLVRAQS